MQLLNKFGNDIHIILDFDNNIFYNRGDDSIMEKQDEDKITEIVESCKVYRGVFIRKGELVRKLEEAYPEK